MTDLLDVQDEISEARGFVECAFFVCEGMPESDRCAAVCTVLDAARVKLNAAFDKLDGLRSDLKNL